jgi:hypothetical protein
MENTFEYPENTYLYFIDTRDSKLHKTLFKISLHRETELYMEYQKTRWLNIVKENGSIPMRNVVTKILTIKKTE